MKFVASIVALLLAFWVAVKLGLLAYHGLLHLLHLMIGLMPFFLGAAGACVLGALGYAIVTRWNGRREMAAQRTARRGVARYGVAARLTPKSAHVAARAANRSSQQASVTVQTEPAVWRPSAGRASERTPAAASPPRQEPRPATARRLSAWPARLLFSRGAALGYHWPAGRHDSLSIDTTPIAPGVRPASSLTSFAHSDTAAFTRDAPSNRRGPSGSASASPRQPLAPESPSLALAQPTGGLERVILIERCSGVQVGRDNDQYSTYQVSMPTAAVESSQALADQLLRRDVPWSRDLFGHDGRPVLDGPSGGPGASSHGLVAGPDGDTLVIVRNSRGVQVGDHNVQHNEFRIRVTDVTVQATGLGMTPARRDAISRLRTNPGDRGAARVLAKDIARVASAELTADLTARLAKDVGHSQVGWPATVHDRTGIQAGDHNRARVTIKVATSRLETQKLERQFRKSAEKLARVTAETRETISRPAADGITRDGPASPRISRGIEMGI
jgi:hypothetical protein